MTVTRLARRLGLDGNPLRRRTDKVAACLAALLVAVFLIGAPCLAVAAADWAGRTGAARQQPAHPGRQVSTVLRQAAPVPSFGREVLGYFQVQARWAASDRRARAVPIPAGAGPAARHTIPPRLDAAGRPSHRAVLARQAAAVVVATAILGTVLMCLAWAGRRLLDRRRLANWETTWAIVGPQWTKRFRSRG